MSTITISQLPPIGTAFTPSSIIPIVQTSGVVSTDQTSLGNLGNYILTQAGNSLQPAYLSNFAYSVTNAAQPSITSVGTLTGLAVSGISNLGSVINIKIAGGLSSQVLSTDGTGNLSWVTQTGGGNGSTGNVTFSNTTISTAQTLENITIQTYDSSNSISYAWNFDSAGNLTMPNQSTGLIKWAPYGAPSYVNAYMEFGEGLSISSYGLVNLTASDNPITGVDGIVFQGAGYTNDSYFDQPTTGGSGIGLTLNYTVNLTEVVSASVANPGDGYLDGDIVTIPGGSPSATVVLYVYTPSSNWQFSADGNLTLPGVLLAQASDNGSIIFSNNGVDNNGSLKVDAGLNMTINANSNFYVKQNSSDRLAITDTNTDLMAASNVNIHANKAGSESVWTFSETGNLTIPGYINLPLVAKLNSGGVGVTNSAEFGTDVTVNGSNVINGSQIYMGAGTAESRAIVNSTGNSLMYIGVENPGFAGTVAVDPGVTSAYAIQVGSNGQIEIGAVVGAITTTEYVAGLGVLNTTGNLNGIFANANVAVIGAGNQGWTFNASGNLTLPNGAVIKDTSGNSVAVGYGAGASQGNQSVAIGENAGANQGSTAVAIGQNAGGGVAYQSDDAVAIGHSAGEDSQGTQAIAIGLYTGQTAQGLNSIALGAYAGQTNQGNNSIILNATGVVLNQTTANTFTVAPVRNDVANISEVMFYNTTSNEVTYGNSISIAGNINAGNIITGTGTTGNITGANVISANTFIGNGSQLTGVATSTTGNWTLAPGVNSANISVPLNGTYSIWVRGNIPNGIITYTATAVVTNNNVPVLGSSYGWYYAVGNALVLTSIPTQFVGTVNNISNAVIVTTTANVFTFGITNNSGANAVVNWGYTKL